MDTIKTLVQNLILIVILTVFLEMLLPSGVMRRYVKVVMGLVVVVSVLQTASALLHRDLNLSLPAIVSSQSEAQIEGIKAAGQNLAMKNQTEALNNYRKSLEHQVLAIAGLNKDFKVVEARVEIEDTPQNKNYGRIREINLTLTKLNKNEENNSESSIPGVEPVTIQVQENKKPTPGTSSEKPASEQVDKIKQTVAGFYNLQVSQVKVSYH